MSPEIAVFDAGPLIAFHQVNRMELLIGVFDRVVVPPAVADEVSPSLPRLPRWVEIQQVHVFPTFAHNLGSGESAAIALAMQLVADFVVLDDKRARTSATRLGLTIIGSLSRWSLHAGASPRPGRGVDTVLCGQAASGGARA